MGCAAGKATDGRSPEREGIGRRHRLPGGVAFDTGPEFPRRLEKKLQLFKQMYRAA